MRHLAVALVVLGTLAGLCLFDLAWGWGVAGFLCALFILEDR